MLKDDIALIGPGVEQILGESFDLDVMLQYPAWTWEDRDLSNPPWLCGGGVPVFKGVYETWAIVNPWLIDNMTAKVGIIRSVRELHREWAIHHGVRRLQCIMQADFREGVSWMRALQYEYESTMYDYGEDGRHMYRFVWRAKEFGL